MNYNVKRCINICQEIHEMLATYVGLKKLDVEEESAEDDSEWNNFFPMKTHEDLEQVENIILMNPAKKTQLVNLFLFLILILIIALITKMNFLIV